MSRWIYEFWNDVADPSWPKVECWRDFFMLENKIQQECYDQHGFAERLKQLDDVNYWQPNFRMYRRDDFIFVNIPKCGSWHHHNFFVDRLGWEIYQPTTRDDLKNYTLFGLMMDPHQRYLKGVTEFLWACHPQHDLEFMYQHLLFPDPHSLPVSMLMGSLIHQVAWIPFDTMTHSDVKNCMNMLFVKQKSNIRVPTHHPAEHVSGLEKQKLFDKFKHHFYNHDSSDNNAALVHRLLLPDWKFYRQLLQEFTPDWQHLN